MTTVLEMGDHQSTTCIYIYIPVISVRGYMYVCEFTSSFPYFLTRKTYLKEGRI